MSTTSELDDADRPTSSGRLTNRSDETRAFFPPGRIEARPLRRHKIIIATLILFGLLKGAYWVVLTPAWSPLDEAQHFGYVEALARGHGIPTVGTDLIEDTELESIKAAPTSPYRSHPYQPSRDFKFWGATAHQYEAIHGPTYYAVMVPAYWLGAPFGVAGSLYAIRFATVVVAVAAIPLAWLLARRLFPDKPVVWLLSAAVLTALDSISPGGAGNDAMILLLGTLSMVLLLRSFDNPRRLLPAALFGITCAATIITKTTSLALLPLSAAMAIAWITRMRPPLAVVARWTAAAGLAAIVTMTPWLAWNFHAYGAPSASSEVETLTGGHQAPRTDLSLTVLDNQFEVARNSGVWSNQSTNNRTYTAYWEWLYVGSALGGIVAAGFRRRWRDLGTLIWCASALPLAFLTMEAIVWIVFGGGGGPMGRHLNVALAPTAVAVAAGCVMILDERRGACVLSGGLAGSLVLAVPMYHKVIDTTYLSLKRPDGVAPVLTQTWSHTVTTTEAIDIDPSCPVQALGIGFQPPTAPGTIIVTTDDGRTVTGTLDESTTTDTWNVREFVPTYDLAQPVTGNFVVTAPQDTVINISHSDPADWISMGEGLNDPVAIVFCQVSDPDEVTFKSIYPVLHPGWVSLRLLRGLPFVFAGAGVAGAVATATWALRSSIRSAGTGKRR